VVEREDSLLKPEDLKRLLAFPAECKEVDYKAAVGLGKRPDFNAKLVKHILGFTNSGGGHIVIGYKEQSDGSHVPDPDMTEEISKSYDVTPLCECVERYIEGQDRIRIKVHREEYGGIKYPIICIYPFEQYPLYCTRGCDSEKGGAPILTEGHVYMRTEGARTIVVATIHDLQAWRQLLMTIGAYSGK
jgi:predicted HTH transcriptional regulator